jgi:Uma2 family endonuclease
LNLTKMGYLDPSQYPDTSHLIFQDDTPLDSFINEKQQRLLTTVFYSGGDRDRSPVWLQQGNESFIVAANVGLFGSIRQSPIVPDVFLSLNVDAPQEWWDRDIRSYLFWEFGKPPEIAIEVVSPTPGNELGSKLQDYAQLRVAYYVVYDPLRRLGEPGLRVFELRGGSYIPKIDTWFPEVGLGLTVWRGTFEGINTAWLRWRYEDGEVIPTGDELAAVKNREISEKDREISEKDREISEKDREISEKDREISEKDREISEKEQEIAQIKEQAKRSLLASIELGLKLKFSAESTELLAEITQIEDLGKLAAIATNLPTIPNPAELRSLLNA